jgi:hypothetical protein
MRDKYTIRIRGASLRVSRLRGLPPVTRPTYSQKVVREYADNFFSLHIEHVSRASVRGGSTVIPNETNAPERVLQATGQYSICHWGRISTPLTNYVLVTSPRAVNKSVGYKAVGRLLGLEEGSWGVS